MDPDVLNGSKSDDAFGPLTCGEDPRLSKDGSGFKGAAQTPGISELAAKTVNVDVKPAIVNAVVKAQAGLTKG